MTAMIEEVNQGENSQQEVNQAAFLDFLKSHYQKDGENGLSEEVYENVCTMKVVSPELSAWF